MTKRLWAGLDAGVETTSICVIDESGGVIHEASCRTNVLLVHKELAFLRRRRRFFHVGIEAGTGIALARGLRSLGYCLDVYETRQLSKFLRLRRNKTDGGDANGIAQAGRLGAPLISKVHLKTLESQILSSRLTIRRQLIRTRVRLTNLLCRQLELFGGRVPVRAGSTLFAKEVDLQIRTLFGKVQTPFTSELRYLLKKREELIVYQNQIDSELKREAMDNEICRRFMVIPGVGPICALTFYAAIGEPHRFERSANVGSFLGLTPRLYQSGLTQRNGRISKMGPVAARSLLVQSSIHFMSSKDADPRLRDWAIRIGERRGKRRANVALARKLATIMLAMWKNGEPYRPEVSRAPAQVDHASSPGLDLAMMTHAEPACRDGYEASPGHRRIPLGPGRPLFYIARRSSKTRNSVRMVGNPGSHPRLDRNPADHGCQVKG